MRRVVKRIAMAVLAVVALTAAGHTQTFPDKPIRLVIGYPPGGGIDFTGRLIADHLARELRQPVVVENRPGAGGQIGADAVSKARADGTTLLFTVGSDLVWMKYMTKRKTIDPLQELTPIATAVASVSCLAVDAGSPYKTLEDLVDYGRQNPGKLTYGTAGVQTVYYLYGEMLKQNGLSMTHVPYTGTPPIVPALLAHEIDVGALTLAIARPLADGGKLRLLGVFDPTRYPGTPDAPAIKEVLPGFNAPVSWFGFFAPPGLPPAIAERLNADVAKAVQSPDVEQKIAAQSQRPMITPYSQMRPLLQQTTDIFHHLIQSANIQPLD
jgi:tripartite-type tricarboxylate transporter receptor subunit TctC